MDFEAVKRADIVPGESGQGPVGAEPGQVALPPPSPGSDGSRPISPKRRRLVPLGAAAATMLTVGALAFAAHRTAAEPASLPGPAVESSATTAASPGTSAASPGTSAARPGITAQGPGSVPADPTGLIVRDGDLVEVSGPVEKGSWMCSPSPVPATFGPCPSGIRVPGVDPAYGVTLRARWHASGLSDIRRMVYSPSSAGELGTSYLPDTPPCPAPSGGWRDGEDWSGDRVDAYLRAHAGQFAEPFATHVGNARILVVEVVNGDVDRARAALTAISDDNLCVVAAPGGHSIAAEDALQATTGKAVGALMDDKESGIYLAASEDGKIRVMMLQLTRPLYDKFVAIGLDHLILDPWIRPVAT